MCPASQKASKPVETKAHDMEVQLMVCQGPRWARKAKMVGRIRAAVMVEEEGLQSSPNSAWHLDATRQPCVSCLAMDNHSLTCYFSLSAGISVIAVASSWCNPLSGRKSGTRCRSTTGGALWLTTKYTLFPFVSTCCLVRYVILYSRVYGFNIITAACARWYTITGWECYIIVAGSCRRSRGRYKSIVTVRVASLARSRSLNSTCFDVFVGPTPGRKGALRR